MRFARYLRQMRLGDVGEAGQARLASARTDVRMVGTAGRIAARYLAGAGVGTVGVDASLVDDVRAANRDIDVRRIIVSTSADDVEAGAADLAGLDPSARELARGALYALAELRRVLAA